MVTYFLKILLPHASDIAKVQCNWRENTCLEQYLGRTAYDKFLANTLDHRAAGAV